MMSSDNSDMPSDSISGMPKAEFRPSARALLIDDSDRVLLMRVTTPNNPDIRLWITPGGGLDAGETREDAALRELYEETGLQGVELGPCVWTRRHTWQWEDEWIDLGRVVLLAASSHIRRQADGAGRVGRCSMCMGIAGGAWLI